MKWFSMILLIVVAFAACKSNKKELISNIEKAEKGLDSLSFNTSAADREKIVYSAIKAYDEFAEAYPDDSNTAHYLFKASRTFEILGRYENTVEYLDKIISNYPDHTIIPKTLFFKAFIHDEHLKDKGTAQKLYEEVIEKYPDSHEAEQAQYSLNILHKPIDEVIREFEAKNQPTETADSVSVMQ